MLKIFYGTIVVENAELIPAKGEPWFVSLVLSPRFVLTAAHDSIVCANHSNSLTDALYVRADSYGINPGILNLRVFLACS